MWGKPPWENKSTMWQNWYNNITQVLPLLEFLTPQDMITILIILSLNTLSMEHSKLFSLHTLLGVIPTTLPGCFSQLFVVVLLRDELMLCTWCSLNAPTYRRILDAYLVCELKKKLQFMFPTRVGSLCRNNVSPHVCINGTGPHYFVLGWL